jgi:HSP20 family protein
MSSTRWDPLRDISGFREAMNNLFEEGMLVPRGAMSTPGSIPLDIRETRDRYVISAPLPGVTASDVDIAVLGSNVRISGEIKDRDAQTEQDSSTEIRWLLRERRFGRFERSITLPTSVNSQEATAEFKDGVLYVELPKVEEARPKTIQIRTNEPS